MSGRQRAVQQAAKRAQPPRSRGISTSTPALQPVFQLAGAKQGVERSQLGRKTLDKIHRYTELPQADHAGASLVTSERHFGARVVRLASSATNNALDLALVRALRKRLQQLEHNPSVTVVILQGQTEGIFSSGTDLARLQALGKGEGRYTGATAEARMVALQHLQEQYRLHHLIATYSKPIVAGMTGTVEGSAWALGQHAAYTYVSGDTSVRLPEVGAGLVPHGGASYHLARVPDGVGMWAALTGAPVPGKTAYWSGLSPLYGSTADVRDTLVKEVGDVSSDVACGTDLYKDPVYIKAMATIRAFRGENASFEADDEDDISTEMYEQYFKLKRWYQTWAAGDSEGAQAILEEDDMGMWEPQSEGDYNDVYRGADSRRQLFPSRFGEEYEGSYMNAPSSAAAERRARIGAVSAHAAALFRGDLGSGPQAKIVAQLGVVRRVFGASKGEQSVLVTSPVPTTPYDTYVATVAAMGEKAFAEAPAGKDPRLVKGWEDRLPAAPGREGLRLYLLRACEKGGLVNDPDLLEMGLTNAEAQAAAEGSSAAGGAGADAAVSGGKSKGTLRDISAALPPIPLEGAVEMVKLATETAWPSGDLTESQALDIMRNILGKTPLGELKVPVPAGENAAFLQANLEDALALATARVTAALHGVSAWSMANPRMIEGLQERVARTVGEADGRLKRSAVEGPSGYTVPEVPTVMHDTEWFTDEVTGERTPDHLVLPVNPRLIADPDGLIDSPVESDEDIFWPLHQGSWMGDIDAAGETDAMPILPDNAMGLRPALRPDAAGHAVDVLREDAIRMLNLGLGGDDKAGFPRHYTNLAARYATLARDASDGVPEAVAAVNRLQGSVLGKRGLEQLKTIMAQYAEKEGGRGDDLDIEVAGNRERRAIMHLAWPAMQAAVLQMRLTVFKSMAAACGYKLSHADAMALAEFKADTLEGRKKLQHLYETEADAVARRLLRVYGELVRAASPKQLPLRTDEGEKAAEEYAADAEDPLADLPLALPKVLVNEEMRNTLEAAAARFAAWEAVALGRRTGGTWTVNAPEGAAVPLKGFPETGHSTVGVSLQPKAHKEYTLGWVYDKESGFARLTLQRKGAVAAPEEVAALAAASPAAGPGVAALRAGPSTAAAAGEPGTPSSLADIKAAIVADRAAAEGIDLAQIIEDVKPVLPKVPENVGEARMAVMQAADAQVEQLTDVARQLDPESAYDEEFGFGSDSEGGGAGGSRAGGARGELKASWEKDKGAVTGGVDGERKSGLAGLGSASLPSTTSSSDSDSGSLLFSPEADEAVGDEVGEGPFQDEKEIEEADILEGAGPGGVLPYRQEPLTEPAATEVARAVNLHWDWDTVRDALTDKSGEGIARLFSLPATGRVHAAGALVTDYFMREADGRILPPVAGSIQDIKSRLAEWEARGIPYGLRRNAVGDDDRVQANQARMEGVSGQSAAMAADFASKTLKQLEAQPQGALAATHALIRAAGAVDLSTAMAMEYRALSRLLGLAGVQPNGKAYDAADAAIDTASLLKPLPAGQELQLEGGGFSRSRAAALRASREAAQAKWEAALEAYLANGEGAGVFGDMFRRRFTYTPPVVTDMLGAREEDGPGEDAAVNFTGPVRDLYEAEEAARVREGGLPAYWEGRVNAATDVARGALEHFDMEAAGLSPIEPDDPTSDEFEELASQRSTEEWGASAMGRLLEELENREGERQDKVLGTRLRAVLNAGKGKAATAGRGASASSSAASAAHGGLTSAEERMYRAAVSGELGSGSAGGSGGRPKLQVPEFLQ